MGEYAEDDLMSAMDDEFEDWHEAEPIPTAYEVADYQLATVFYDYKVHPDAQDQIINILKNFEGDLVKELL